MAVGCGFAEGLGEIAAIKLEKVGRDFIVGRENFINGCPILRNVRRDFIPGRKNLEGARENLRKVGHDFKKVRHDLEKVGQDFKEVGQNLHLCVLLLEMCVRNFGMGHQRREAGGVWLRALRRRRG